MLTIETDDLLNQIQSKPCYACGTIEVDIQEPFCLEFKSCHIDCSNVVKPYNEKQENKHKNTIMPMFEQMVITCV